MVRPYDRVRSSPRLRRRLRWLVVAALLVSGVVLLVVLLPSSTTGNAQQSPSPSRSAAAAGGEPVVQRARTRVAPADRRAIDRLLDRFVPAALERKSAAVAWSLSGPELTSGSTLAEWRAGTSPVQPYPARGTAFHDWTVLDASPTSVTFNLLIQPRRGARLAPYVFSGEAIRQGTRWVVNRWYTIAIMNPVRGSTHEIGPADFSAPGRDTGSAGPRVSKVLIVPALAVLGLVLLTPLGLGAGALVRSRRWRRRAAADGRTELPPLPRPR